MGTSIHPVSILRPREGVIQVHAAAGQSAAPVRCLQLVPKRRGVARAVATMETEPPLTGVSVFWYEPGETARALRTALGNSDRAPVSWRAETSGPHYLVVRDAGALGVPAFPTGVGPDS